MFVMHLGAQKNKYKRMDKELKRKWLQYNLEADLEYEEIYGNIFYLLFFNLIHYDLIYGIYGMCTK